MSMDEKVTQVLDILCYQLDKEDARKLLAISGKDVETAVMKFYDTDRGTLNNLLRDSEATWDETAFGAGRYGDNDSALPTFNIDYAPGFDNYPHSAGHSRAPTRPPSRTSQRSVVSTHAGDAPMQSIENTQESGIVGNSNAVFGPATRGTYDASQWAMVPTATELISDPIPSQRQRQEGQPAILKPSPNFNYLPTLIPILHSIPQFRNALLSPGVSQKDYWMGEDWWKGNASPSARIIDTTMGLAETHGRDILYETQRLMAFLDNTDRIYGSVSSLLELDAWKESQPPGLEDPDDELLKFLILWGFAFQAQVPDADLNGALRSIVDVAGQRFESFVLDGTVTRDSSKPGLSVYDVLDDALFSASTGSAHLADISNVLILRLTSSKTDTSDLGCRVPATLYADRYLEKNKHVIDGMYGDMKQYEDQLRDIDAQVQKWKYHTPKKEGAKRVESLKLLETSMMAFQHSEVDAEPKPEDAQVLAQLKDLYQSIETKLTALEDQTQQIQKMRDGISARFKPIVDDGADATMDTVAEEAQYPEGERPQDAMQRPYQLWGVATRRDVVYLLHPDIKSDIPGAKQWWRMQYDTESSNPTIMRDRLTLQDVLERATSESASVLLVYANDDAAYSESSPLPKALEDFAKKDNLNFLEELQKDSAGWETFGDSFGNAAQGTWDTNPPPDYVHGWEDMSAREFHSHNRNDSNMSSTTLTPNTEVDDDGPVMQEMIEVEGTRDVVPRLSSASSETIGGDLMDVDGVKEQGESRSQGEPKLVDVDMDDVREEPRVQHVEVAEKKGG